MRYSQTQWWLLGAVIIAAAISVAAGIYPTFPGDLWITTQVQRLESAPLTAYMHLWSRLGGAAPLVLAALAGVVVLVWRRMRQQALFLAVAAMGYVVSPVVKELVGRPRPSADLVQVLWQESNHSFPSGHALAAALILGALFLLAGSILGPRRPAVLAARVVIVLAIFSIALSRVYLGAHWTSDVFGGLLLGGLILACIRLGFEVYHARIAPPELPGRATAPSPAIRPLDLRGEIGKP